MALLLSLGSLATVMFICLLFISALFLFIISVEHFMVGLEWRSLGYGNMFDVCMRKLRVTSLWFFASLTSALLMLDLYIYTRTDVSFLAKLDAFSLVSVIY